MKVLLTKVSDEEETKTGELLYPPELDKPVYIMDSWRSLTTSPVTEILEQIGEQVTKFKTENSTYTINYL